MVDIEGAINDTLGPLVEQAYRDLDYRPTVSAILLNGSQEILIVQSAKSASDWSFPQGGIDQGERPTYAFFRELGEEFGISPYDLTIKRLLTTETVDAEPGRKDKRGFTKGKMYPHIQADYSGSPILKNDPSEISAYRWVPLNRRSVLEATQTTRAEKREMMLRALVCGNLIEAE